MIVFRLARAKYTNQLSGKGASIKGGRWNSQGTELIYCATNRSLAMAEVVVHLTVGTLPKDYYMLEIEIPKQAKYKTISDLPEDWNIFPHPSLCRHIGDQFVLDEKDLILKVPSAVTQGDFNILINSAHDLFNKVKIKSAKQFFFDRRLF